MTCDLNKMVVVSSVTEPTRCIMTASGPVRGIMIAEWCSHVVVSRWLVWIMCTYVHNWSIGKDSIHIGGTMQRVALTHLTSLTDSKVYVQAPTTQPPVNPYMYVGKDETSLFWTGKTKPDNWIFFIDILHKASIDFIFQRWLTQFKLIN